MVESAHNYNFPTATELLEKNVRSKLRTSEIEEFIEKIDLALSDSDLLDGLRRLRNLFAEGGQDIAEVSWGKWQENIKGFFECFVREEWSAGLSVVLQLLSNMSAIYPIKFLTNENLDDGLLDRLSIFNSKVINFFTAAMYNTLKRCYAIENRLIVSSDRIATICLFLIKKLDEETAKEGWIGLLFSYLWNVSPEVFSYMLDKAKEDTLPTILEFLTDKMKTVPVGGESHFPMIILNNLREFFFLHCNCLLQGGSKRKDSSPAILFEVLKFMGPASSRHKEAFATEPMLVSICGIMKRCWEISQDHKDELQPRLVDGGELPKKSEFLEIMFAVWKDAVRIFANILDLNDKELKRKFQDDVRVLGAIPAILAAAGCLHINQIRPWAIQAINQVTENNLENQEEISSLQNLGNVEGADVTVDRENGKFHFKRISKDI